MISALHLLRRFSGPLALVCAALAFQLSGCAGTGSGNGPEAYGGADSTETAGAPFPLSEVRDVFRTGLRAIDERYIEPVDLERLSCAGLEGLKALDRTLDARCQKGELVLTRADQPFWRAPLPVGQDATSWANLIVDGLQATNDSDPAGPGKTEPEKYYKAVFNALLARLDAFSRYASPHEARMSRGQKTPRAGIGLTFDVSNGGARVIRVYPDTPAANAGLTAGDVLLMVDGQSLAPLNKPRIKDLLEGDAQTSVTVFYRPAGGGTPRTVTLPRTVTSLPTVDVRYEDGMAVLTIPGFSQNTTTAVAQAIATTFRALPGQPIRGFVLDLRGNPGGLLDQAVALSDLFMESGPIVSTRGRHPDARQFYSARPGDLLSGMPLVVLIDGDSASSAEIVAAALQDSGRAVVIGTASYGKGTVQTLIPLPDGGEIFLTWSRYYSPSGYVPDGLGVLPTLCTSGHENTADASLILDEARDHPDRATAEGLRWRASVPGDKGTRRALRELCPPEPHAMSPVEILLARTLLDDPRLYQSLLRPDTGAHHNAHDL